MTARTLLLCCGVVTLLANAPGAPTPALASGTPVQADVESANDLPHGVRQIDTLIVEAGETLEFKGPVEFVVDGDVRIDGTILIDGAETSGRPDLTIRAFGSITINADALLQTLSHGPGAHGGSIRLLSADSIHLHGKLDPSDGVDGETPGQAGGDGGGITLEAPFISTSMRGFRAGHGGHGAPSGDGGDGGSVHVFGAVLWASGSNSTGVMDAGDAGDGGHAVAYMDDRPRHGGNGGDGGNAIHRPWHLPDWLREAGSIKDPAELERRSADATNGANGTLSEEFHDLHGAHGFTGIHAMAGHGGHGGHGAPAQIVMDRDGNFIRFFDAERAGSGGAGGTAIASRGGHGGDAASPVNHPTDHPYANARGGRGGFGGQGGSAHAGNGGNAGLGGTAAHTKAFPQHAAGSERGQDGAPGPAGHAISGHGGHGGDGGDSRTEAGERGLGGSEGRATPGKFGVSAASQRGVGPHNSVERGYLKRGHRGQAGVPGKVVPAAD
jgi:hypothetical protein